VIKGGYLATVIVALGVASAQTTAKKTNIADVV
jgi:hypothetical protein